MADPQRTPLRHHSHEHRRVDQVHRARKVPLTVGPSMVAVATRRCMKAAGRDGHGEGR